METSVMDLINNAPSYSVVRGSSGYPTICNIYKATTEIAMWSDPDVENRLKDMEVNEHVSFERKLPFGDVEMFYVTRIS